MPAAEHVHKPVAADDVGHHVRGPRHRPRLLALYPSQKLRYRIQILAHAMRLLGFLKFFACPPQLLHHAGGIWLLR